MFKVSILAVLALGLIGCGDSGNSSASSTSTTASATASTDQATTTGSTTSSTTGSASSTTGTTATTGSTPPATTAAVATPPKAGEDVGVIETNLGRIVVKFFPDKAPGHVKNFETLAKKGFYDGTKFHRVIPDFMIQGGDPNSKDNDRSNDGVGGPGYTIKAEFNDIHHGPGILSMARTDDPDSAGSQFFIMVGDNADLDNKYSAFGQVVEGMDVANKIVALPRDAKDNPLDANPAIVKSIKIKKWPLK